jgi:hypothetical protein
MASVQDGYAVRLDNTLRSVIRETGTRALGGAGSQGAGDRDQSFDNIFWQYCLTTLVVQYFWPTSNSARSTLSSYEEFDGGT